MVVGCGGGLVVIPGCILLSSSEFESCRSTNSILQKWFEKNENKQKEVDFHLANDCNVRKTQCKFH